MKLSEYVDRKYRGQVAALNVDEARAWGVPYPLKAGWLERHGDAELSEPARIGLIAALERRSTAGDRDKRRATKYARIGVEILSFGDPADEFARLARSF